MLPAFEHRSLMSTTPTACAPADTAFSGQSGPATHHMPEEILSHPRFATARDAYIEGLFGLYDNNHFMNRLLIEATRSIVFFTALVLWADYEPQERATWPTLGLLKQRVAPYGLSTGRRIEALISRFVDAGYLTLSVPATDRRLRIITPTDKMMEHDLEWLAVHYRPLQILFPETGYHQPMQRDPVFQRNLRRIAKQFATYAAQLMANNPDVMFFLQRDAGTMILLKLLSLGNADGAARVSLGDLADRFGISRTHVRKTILEAENRSLLQYSATMITLAPGLVAAYDRFVADTMSGHDAMFKMAMS